jgi:hypothetical protein
MAYCTFPVLDVPTFSTTSTLPRLIGREGWSCIPVIYMFSTFATSRLREILADRGGNMWAKMAGKFSLQMPDIYVAFRDLLHAVNLRHGTHSFTSLPKEGVLRIFFSLKNLTASAVFEPANLCSKGQHATSGLQKPLHEELIFVVRSYYVLCNLLSKPPVVKCQETE